MSLSRRTPLRRTPLRRTGINGLDFDGLPPKRRTGLRPISTKRAAAKAGEAEVRAAVFARDGHRCMLSAYGVGPCSGRLTFHHLRKASQGGTYTADNGLTLCVLHNEWVEIAPDVAWMLGLVIRTGDAPDLAASRRLARGIVVDRRR